MELDRFDRLLLRLVQEDSAQTADQLAEKVELSASAIQRRLRKLREQGVIAREIAVLDPAAISRPTHFVVGLQVERERPEVLSRLRAWINAHENVQQAFYVTGESDFVLIVTASDAESYQQFMALLMRENPNVKRFTTNVVMNMVKRGLSIPVPLSEE